MKQKVVVIGHGFTSRLSIIRAVGMIDCEVIVIVMAWKNKLTKRLDKSIPVDCLSKYVSKVYWCYYSDEDGLLRILLEKCKDSSQKVIIIPDSDFSAAVIDLNQDKLKEYFLFPHIHHYPGAVVDWMNKERQKLLAEEVGLNVPKSCVINVVNKHFSIPDTIDYPCFTKPLATVEGGKRCLRRNNNEDELRSLLTQIACKGDLRVLVEDFKTIDKEFAVLGFSDGTDVVIPAVIKFVKGSRSHPGIAMQGMVMPIKGFEDIIEKFKEFVRRIGFFGIFDIDFYKSKGVQYFGELNLRFGGSGSAVTQMGVNLPGMFVKAIKGDDISDMNKSVSSSAIYVNDRMCLDDWYRGFITTKEYNHFLNSADITFVRSVNDPQPQSFMKKMFIKTKFKKIIKKCISFLKR